MQVLRRGVNWIMFEGREMSQGRSLPSGAKTACGPGSLPPVVIAPEVLAQLRPGQQIDQDPHTRFVVRVGAVDARSVAVQSDGPLQSITFVYERAQGLLTRIVIRDRSLSLMMKVYDLQLAGRS